MKHVIGILLLFLPLDASAASDVITGNKFKSLCKYCFDEHGFKVNDSANNNLWFVKTDMLPQFFQNFMPAEDYILVSHNADHGVTNDFHPYLDMPNLIHWYGQNIETRHPKLTSIPIGLCNFANHKLMKKAQEANYPKKTLVYANYSTSTNSEERNRCLEKTGVPLARRKNFKKFLKEMAMSYFVISPNGNGVDCHRTWEALYLKAIPIVTRSINSEFYAGLPIIILDSWEDFKNLELSEELYYELWGDFDPDSLTVDSYITDIK